MINLNNIKLYNTYCFVFNVYDKTKEIIGAPYLIQENPLEIKMVKLDGTTVSLVEVKEISSVRLAPNVRQVLKEYAMSHANLYRLEKQYKEQILAVKNTILTYKKTLKRVTGIMDTYDFNTRLECSISNKVGVNMNISSWCFVDDKDSYVEIEQTSDICKWATPEEYPFINREYDGTLRLNYEHYAVKKYAEKYAPQILLSLKRVSYKTEKRLTIGDKGTLCAHTVYKIPIKFGCTEKSVEDILSIIYKGIKFSRVISFKLITLLLFLEV